MAVACCSLMTKVIPLRSTKRESVPACSCLMTAALAGIFITSSGVAGEGDGGGATFGRPLPLWANAVLVTIVDVRIIKEKTLDERLKYCTNRSSLTANENHRGRQSTESTLVDAPKDRAGDSTAVI